MLDNLISKIDVINYRLTNFRENFYQGSDFFKKRMSEGSFKACDLRGSDFRRSKLSNIDFSEVRCGRSFIRLIMLIGCFLFSLYVAYNLSVIFQDSIMTEGFEQQEGIIVNLMFKISFLYSLAFSIYYEMGSSLLYNFFESKAVFHGMIINKSLLSNFMKVIIFPLKVIYLPAFGVTIASIAILFLGTDSVRDILIIFLHPTDNYQKNIASYFIAFKVFGFVLTTLGFLVSGFFSTSLLMLTTSFDESMINDTSFYNALMNGISFKGSKLVSINFKSTSLKFVNFSKCYFESVDFENSNLTGCDFTGSNLADLKEVNFKNAILDGAHYKKGNMTYHASTIPGLVI